MAALLVTAPSARGTFGPIDFTPTGSVLPSNGVPFVLFAHDDGSCTTARVVDRAGNVGDPAPQVCGDAETGCSSSTAADRSARAPAPT